MVVVLARHNGTRLVLTSHQIMHQKFRTLVLSRQGMLGGTICKLHKPTIYKRAGGQTVSIWYLVSVIWYPFLPE